MPLWWRRIPADFRFPLMQGKFRVTPDDEKSQEFKHMLTKVRKLLAMTPTEQEAALLLALIDENLLGGRGSKKSEKNEAMRKKFDGLKTADEMVGELLRLANDDPKTWGHPTFRVLYKGGMAKTLAIVEKLPKGKAPWTERQFEYILEDIRVRLAKRDPVQRADPDDPIDKTPPTAEELAILRKAPADPKSEDWHKALVRLTRHHSESVAEMLMKWMSPEADKRRQRVPSHGIASYFAVECGKDREKILTVLLDAADPWIRVTAAVYLCFENQEKGVAALKKMAMLEGTPGAYAALTLARRGHKDAVPCALELFPKQWTEESDADNFSTVEENLQNHLLVLLSNAARAGNAPQYRPAKDSRPTLDSLQTWWRENQANVVLRDPWMEILAKQKID